VFLFGSPPVRVRFEVGQDFRLVKLNEPPYAVKGDALLPHPEVNRLVLNPKSLRDLTRADQWSLHFLTPLLVHVVVRCQPKLTPRKARGSGGAISRPVPLFDRSEADD
jgi:hypothetical protein